MPGTPGPRGPSSAGGKAPRRSAATGAASRAQGAAADPVRAGAGRKRGQRLPMGLGTRRAAVLALVVCALALALAVPLRTYVSQRQEMAAAAATRAQLTDEVAQLQAQKDQLADPAYVASLARGRLGFVRPGETPYRVQLPDAVASATAGQQQAPASGAPWYSSLWGTVAGSGG